MAEAEMNYDLYTNQLRSLGDGDTEPGSNGERRISLIDCPFQNTADGENANGNVIDIDKWVGSLEMILEDVPPYMCIPGHPGKISKMVMPCLHVDDNTNSLLRNLIALEQMKYPNLGLNVSAYAVLLLHLVTVPEDVMLLRRKGIIKHHLASDKEMMYLVNRLSVGLAFDYAEDDYSLKPVFKELKRYSERRVPRWRAWLKHRYFNNPWTAISFFAASLLLILSFVQTFYSVYSYYHPYFGGHH